MKYKFHTLLIILSVIFFTSYSSISFSGQTSVRRGDTVILIAPLSDGVTYEVQTSYGMEIWKDRDLYYFAGVQEMCRVIKS